MSKNMKPSGIEWIGDIPESWRIGRIEHNYEVILGKMVTPEQESPDQTLENYLCAANIRWNGVDLEINKQMWYSSKEKGQYLLKKGDVLIMEGGSIGTTSVYNGEFEPCYIQNSVHCCRGIKSNNTKLLYYWMYLTYNSGFLDVVCNKATIAHYTKEKVCKTPLVLISPEEQELIVDFLDKQCKKIDSIIIDLEKQIEILQKYKKSLITETVTRGLDKSVSMNDCGVEWIGVIPEGWNIKRIKYLATLKGRIGWQGLTSDEYTDEGPFLITGVDFVDGRVDWDSCVHITKERWEEASEIQIKNGDLLITKDGTVGKVAIVSELNNLASLNSGVLVIKTNEKFNRRFLYWVLQSEEFWTWFKLKNAGNSTIIHLYQKDFEEFCYTYPEEDEQIHIADFLDEQNIKIDSIVESKKEQLTKVIQHKKSLIYEYVTGKKRVKGAQSNGN